MNAELGKLNTGLTANILSFTSYFSETHYIVLERGKEKHDHSVFYLNIILIEKVPFIKCAMVTITQLLIPLSLILKIN